MNEKTLEIIFFVIWIGGFILNWIMSYVLVKMDQKVNPRKRYTWKHVIDMQYECGGPLVLIPFMGFIISLMMIVMYLTYNKFKLKNFLDKEI